MIRKYLQDWFSFSFQAGLLTSEFELTFLADTLILIRNTWYLDQLKIALKSAVRSI